jgi:hypothetical protein
MLQDRVYTSKEAQAWLALNLHPVAQYTHTPFFKMTTTKKFDQKRDVQQSDAASCADGKLKPILTLDDDDRPRSGAEERIFRLERDELDLVSDGNLGSTQHGHRNGVDDRGCSLSVLEFVSSLTNSCV